MRFRTTAVLALGALLLTSCSAGGKPTKTAEQIGRDMAVPDVHVVNADDSHNHLIGRAGQYTTVAALVESDLAGKDGCTGRDPGVDCGSKVEVFPAPKDASARADHLTQAAPGETHVLSGPYLLRIRRDASPEQVARLRGAFEKAAQ